MTEPTIRLSVVESHTPHPAAVPLVDVDPTTVEGWGPIEARPGRLPLPPIYEPTEEERAENIARNLPLIEALWRGANRHVDR